MNEPLDLFKEIDTNQQRMIRLGSGGFVSVELMDKNKARVLEVISTDPMDYMNDQIQPGTVLEMNFPVEPTMPTGYNLQ
ncbi:MAG: YlzJ-like family protein [Bacillota bacterium]|nr:YlzJ-like family protein [Bacillota bacterium]